MTGLDRLIPNPRLAEIDRADFTAPPERVWQAVRHLDLGRSPLARGLFALRTIPERLGSHGGGRPARSPLSLSLDDLRSSPERPGFQVLVEDPPREVAVGAVGRVWRMEIPFRHVADAGELAAFHQRGFVKVAWALRVSPAATGGGTHLEVEVRVGATDEASWKKFRRYFRLIGPASRFIRRDLLASLADELGAAEARHDERSLPGDALLSDAAAQVTHAVDIAARPEAIWPWLVQMGCHRGGFYSHDLLDNGGARSAREIHPELQRLEVGDVIPARPRGDGGFEVLALEPKRALVLGGLYDTAAGRQLAFAAPRPDRFWQTSWSFVLEPLDERSTRLFVRARAAVGGRGGRRHLRWIRHVHAFMQSAQLRHLAARIEGRVTRDDWRDIADGLAGVAVMLGAAATPFWRGRRARWGVDGETAAHPYPGDRLVRAPRWGWTHAVEIDAPATEVWPWVAQLGTDRGGFYSYQWLENLAGCRVRNAEAVHPEWEARPGDGLLLHPRVPPLAIASLEPGRHLVVHAPGDPAAQAAGRAWAAASWLFLVEPLGPRRSRLVSRYRADCSADLATRLAFGPGLLEPVGFAMDRRMLLGVKRRVERAAAGVAAAHPLGAAA